MFFLFTKKITSLQISLKGLCLKSDVNNIADAVTYAETANNTIENVELANVTITRNIKEGFNTIVLPFDLTIADVQAAFGTGTQVYTFEDVANGTNSTINFNRNNAGTISANVPVLINATQASTSQVFNGVEVKASSEAKVEGTNFDFVGIYAPVTVAEKDYFISNGAVYKSIGATNLNAFRAYIFNKDKSVGGTVKMYIDGTATSISEINGEAAEDGIIFNLAGQRVNKARKGVNIVNGKKIVVK